jgi:carbon monoxide dehydrogenase subunit G
MTEGLLTFRVNKPPEAVFPFVGNLERAPEWVPDLLTMQKVGDEPVGVGTRYDETVRMGSKTSKATLEVTEYDPPYAFAHKGQGGPSHFTARFVLKPDGHATIVTHEYSVRITGMAKLLTPVISGWVRRNTETGIDNLKRLIEDGKV